MTWRENFEREIAIREYKEHIEYYKELVNAAKSLCNMENKNDMEN